MCQSVLRSDEAADVGPFGEVWLGEGSGYMQAQGLLRRRPPAVGVVGEAAAPFTVCLGHGGVISGLGSLKGSTPEFPGRICIWETLC